MQELGCGAQQKVAAHIARQATEIRPKDLGRQPIRKDLKRAENDHQAGLEIEERKDLSKAQQLYFDLMAAHERDRQRITSELHDGLGQSLSILKLRLDSMICEIRGNWPRSHMDQMNEIALKVQAIMDEVRSIAAGLRPSILDDFGLLATMKYLGRELQTTHKNMRIEFILEVAEDGIPSELTVPIYRVLQESLHNVAKHAKAAEVQIQFYKQSGRLVLRVGDDGCGFVVNPIQAPSAGRGMGLASMRARVMLSSGNFTVKSSPGHGTLVEASWPDHLDTRPFSIA